MSKVSINQSETRVYVIEDLEVIIMLEYFLIPFEIGRFFQISTPKIVLIFWLIKHSKLKEKFEVKCISWLMGNSNSQYTHIYIWV